MGWSPAYVETTPAPVSEEIAAWLRGRRSTGVLLAGSSGLELAYLGADSVVVHPLAEEGALSHAMLERYQRVSTSWDALLGYCADEDEAFENLSRELITFLEEQGWRELAEHLVEIFDEQKIETLVVLGRGIWRQFPWECLRVGGATLGERVRVVHLPTLSAVGAKPAPLRSGVLPYVVHPRRPPS